MNFPLWRLDMIRMIWEAFEYLNSKVASTRREKAIVFNQSNFPNKMNFLKLTLAYEATSCSKQINITLEKEHCFEGDFDEISLHFMTVS